MKGVSLPGDGWTLGSPNDAEIDQLMGWFSNAHSVAIWGGPEFRFPFTRQSFIEDCRFGSMSSYCLRDQATRMVAFGQLYSRYDRAHLARLITDPARRREGAGRRLITMIIEAAKQSGDYTEASLFVFRDNEPAYRCYRSLGFSVQDYPDDATMKDKCYFLTRAIELEEAQQA